MFSPRDDNTELGRTLRSVLGLGAALTAFLLVCRAIVVGLGLKAFVTGWMLPRALGAFYFDLLFVECLVGAFLLCAVLLRSRPRGLRLVRRTFYVAAVVTLLLGIVNVKASKLLGTPVNYQWLYYSDFLTSLSANQAVADTLSVGLVLGLLGCQIGMFIVAWGLGHVLRRTLVGWKTSTLALVAGVVGSWVYFSIAGPYMTGRSDYTKFANPVCSFVSSVFSSSAESESLLTIETLYGKDDFLTVGERKEPPPTAGRPEIRNVILFVFESVPAMYCETYGGTDPVTPRLKAARKNAIQFSRIYSHAPSTNKAIVSITCSVYPWISYRSISREYPALPIRSIADALGPHGFRTAVYHAADLTFQGMGDFLEGRGFDVMVDRLSMPKAEGEFDSDDEAAATSFMNWCTAQSEQPFFGMFWTRATHMPYYSRGKLSYGKRDREHIRYLNALQDGDAALGVVIDRLAQAGLTDSTLVVVIADHGEAFGQHSQRGHGVAVYEENVHIPMLLIHPKLFRGESSDVIGGTIDVGPTILDLLGKPMPGEWQGRSLFAKHRPPRTYFLAPWSKNWFGYREGDQKFLYNAAEQTWEHYDLSQDPLELNNLVDDSPASRERVRQAKLRLASWVQSQVQVMRARRESSK